MAKVIEDLQNERDKSTFNIEELTNILDCGPESTEKRRKLEKIVLSVQGLRDDIPEEYLSHKEKYENAIRKAVLLHHTLRSNGHHGSPTDNLGGNLRNIVHAAVFKEHSPFLLNFSMFITAIANLADEEQKKYWLKRVLNMEIIGTYAQTELGHGTYIRGLETTATYDVEKEEFVLHSPTLTSYKWWPGALAHTANYCILMAQLYVKGKHCGIQPFLVQLRDEETHMPLPGVKLGEIGAKFSFNTVNNGFVGFQHHRIPRDMMLMKNAQVLKDGTFKASPNNKLAYGTMVYSRVLMVNGAATNLARAAVIAVRYSAVRRQSQLKPNEPETQVIDYVTQQHKLFVAISTSYAYLFVAKWVMDLYQTVSKDLNRGNMDRLPELHVMSCSLKALSTHECTLLTEKCRLACGGHGYMMSSNLPQLYTLGTASCVYEGENTVLLLQTARSLLKAWHRTQNGQSVSSSMSYLADKSPTMKWDSSVDGIIKSFQKASVGKLSAAVQSINEYVNSGLCIEDASNKASVQLVAAAEAHSRVLVLSIYKMEVVITMSAASLALRTVIEQLVELYAIYWALERTGDLLLYTRISAQDIRDLQCRYVELLEQIRPNAVGLVDAFDYPDEVLNSTLGAYDGRAYERLMEEAMKSPLNQEPVNESFHKYLKPFMRGKL